MIEVHGDSLLECNDKALSFRENGKVISSKRTCREI